MKREINTKKGSTSETYEKVEKVPSWKDIEAKVLKAFDLRDKSQEYGVKEWKEYVEKIRSSEVKGDIIKTFESREVYDVLVSYFISDIEDNIARYRLKLCQSNRQNKLMSLALALGEYDTVFIDEERGEKIVPELLGIASVTNEKIYKRVLQASVCLAQNYTEDKSVEITWPLEVSSDFTDELTTFIKSNGDQGRELIMRICEDGNCANDIYTDSEMPKPLRFLAQMSLEINKNNFLSKKKRSIGFGKAKELSA
jgi:hypothetical protein